MSNSIRIVIVAFLVATSSSLLARDFVASRKVQNGAGTFYLFLQIRPGTNSVEIWTKAFNRNDINDRNAEVYIREMCVQILKPKRSKRPCNHNTGYMYQKFGGLTPANVRTLTKSLKRVVFSPNSRMAPGVVVATFGISSWNYTLSYAK